MKLVTDRTEADVLLGTKKGRYTYEDLNRVEAAVQLLCSSAIALNIDLGLVVKTDWRAAEDFSIDTWPTVSQMARYLGNVHKLCDALELRVSLPGSMRRLGVQEANDIECALEMAYSRIQGILKTYQYSGELYAGEENLL